MKAALIGLWMLSIAAAFAAARFIDFAPQPRASADVGEFRAALLERDELERAYKLSVYLRGLERENLLETLEVLDRHQSGVTPAEIRLLMLAWSRFDAPGAFSWARDWPTPWKNTLIGEAIWAWGYRDGPAALRALEGLGDADLVGRYRSSLMEGWLRSSDRHSATQYIAEIDEPKRRSRLTFVLAAEAARDGADATIAWLEGVPEDSPNDFKQGAFYHAASAVARYEPLRAADWFVQHRDAWYSEGSLDVIARTWASHYDAPKVMEWLSGLPSVEGERATELPEALGAAFGVWHRKEPEAAAEWLAAALPDARLDDAVMEIVRAGAQASPANAAAWAERIEDETQRRRALQASGRSWLDQDPDAARAWIDAADFSDELKQQILNNPRAAAQLRMRQARKRAAESAVAKPGIQPPR